MLGFYLVGYVFTIQSESSTIFSFLLRAVDTFDIARLTIVNYFFLLIVGT